MQQDPPQTLGVYQPIVVEGSITDKKGRTGGTPSLLPPQQLYAQRRAARSFRRLFLLLPPFFLLLGLALGGCYTLWFSTATIHLLPVSASRDTLITITAALRPAGPAQTRLDLLTSTRTAPSIAVQPSGRKYFPAARAGGTLYWYNQEPYAQTIKAGTALTSSTGVVVVTAATVVIGAGALPTSGVAKGPAYAVQVGARGNIPAGSIDLLCGSCGPGISVNNNPAPFSGGRDAVTLAVLDQQDIDQAAASQRTLLVGQALRSLLGQVPPAETTVAAPSCSERLHADHQPGELLALGTVVSLSLSETCSVSAYDPGDALARALALFLAPVAGRFPSDQFTARISAIPQKRTLLSAGGVALPFRVHGHWVYRISSREQRDMQRQIAGQPREQALRLLSHSPGVGQASIDQAVPWFPLPSDPQRIAIVPLASGG